MYGIDPLDRGDPNFQQVVYDNISIYAQQEDSKHSNLIKPIMLYMNVKVCAQHTNLRFLVVDYAHHVFHTKVLLQQD